MSAQKNFFIEKILSAIKNINYNEAEFFLKQILKIYPKDHECLRLYGVLLAMKGEHDQSLYFLKKALEISPKNALVFSNLGNVYSVLNQNELASDAYKKSLRIDSTNEETWFNQGNLFLKLEKFDESLESYEKALILNNNFTPALIGKAVVLLKFNQIKEAKELFEIAINSNPQCIDNKILFANALVEIREYDFALQIYQNILLINPKFAEIYSNIGNIYICKEEYPAAIEYFKKALLIKPEYSEACMNLGTAYSLIGENTTAINYYQRAVNSGNSVKWALGHYIHAKMINGLWYGIDKDISNLKDFLDCNSAVAHPFTVLSLIDDPSYQKLCSEIYVKNKYSANNILSEIGSLSNNEDKIRIGYFSADFCDHAVGHLTVNLFEKHNRENFMIFGFSLREHPKSDGVADRIKCSFDKYIEAHALSDFEIAKLARQYKIDIAVDLSGHTLFSRPGIFSHRAAPIQINWLGYPGTSGANYMDYILADHYVVPEVNKIYFSEQVIYLPNSYMVGNNQKQIPTNIFSKSNLGLPEDRVIYCCFNNSYKFNELTLNSWAKILNSVKDSIIWISENNNSFRENIIKEFTDRGIVQERVIFAKKMPSMSEHFSRLPLADIFLDTFIYNAHTTALDSLSVGVPLITLLGNSFPARVASSLLNSVGMPELISKNIESYENLAIELGIDRDKLCAVKKKLKLNIEKYPLFNQDLFVENIEDVYKSFFKAT